MIGLFSCVNRPVLLRRSPTRAADVEAILSLLRSALTVVTDGVLVHGAVLRIEHLAEVSQNAHAAALVVVRAIAQDIVDVVLFDLLRFSCTPIFSDHRVHHVDVLLREVQVANGRHSIATSST